MMKKNRRSLTGDFLARLRSAFAGVFTLSLLFWFTALTAQDSSHIRISLLTCTPGAELYSTFGHTAIRVTDSLNLKDFDNVFNYGTFRFDDPDFYTRFIRGKLSYYLSVEKFTDFKFAYQADNRGISEQELNMTPAEKISLMEALYENAKEENRYYQYDFFLDNCTTRARDILLSHKKGHQAFKPVMPEGTRFRQAIHFYLDQNHKYWSKFGIDLLLGSPTDAVMTIAQSQFLPDNLMKSFDSSNEQHQLVLSSSNLYEFNDPVNKGSLLTPMFTFSLLLVAIVLLSFSRNKTVVTLLEGFDGLLFFTTGLLGILFIFMWVGTDHSMTKNNYNLLWAWPTHAVAAFFANSSKPAAIRYFAFCGVILFLVLLCWSFLPQQLNNALVPYVLLLAFRSIAKYFCTLRTATSIHS